MSKDTINTAIATLMGFLSLYGAFFFAKSGDLPLTVVMCSLFISVSILMLQDAVDNRISQLTDALNRQAWQVKESLEVLGNAVIEAVCEDDDGDDDPDDDDPEEAPVRAPGLKVA